MILIASLIAKFRKSSELHGSLKTDSSPVSASTMAHLRPASAIQINAFVRLQEHIAAVTLENERLKALLWAEKIKALGEPDNRVRLIAANLRR